MICILQATRRYLKEISPLSLFRPIWRNSKFSPRENDEGFKMWADKGVKMIKDVYGRDGNMLVVSDSFEN